MSDDSEVYAPGPGDCQRIAVTTTASRTQLTNQVKGPGYVRVWAQTANVDVLFGDNTVTVNKDETATAAQIGITIPAGTFMDFYLTSETYVGWDADASGFLGIAVVGKRRVKNY